MKVQVLLIIASFAAALAERVHKSSVPAPELARAPNSEVARIKRSYDRWLDLIAQYGRRGGVEGGASQWQPFPVDLPVTGKDGQTSSLPVLVLPVPVPVPDPRVNPECEANKHRGGNDKYREDRFPEPNKFRPDTGRNEDRNKPSGDTDRYRPVTDRSRPDTNRYRPDINRYRPDTDGDRPISDKYRPNSGYQGDNGVNSFNVRGGPVDELFEEPQGRVPVDYLIELFRQQQPTAPELPPALIDYAPQIIPPRAHPQGSGSISDQRKYLPPADTPSPPRFEKSLKIRGFLTVPRADYTEAYTAWYDAPTGAARVDYHDGGAMSVRAVSSEGRVKRSVMHTDRTTENDIRVCGVTSSDHQMKPEDRLPPGLPSTDGFEFGGYREEFGGKVEVWKRKIAGGPGEIGAVRGESLTYHHELLVSRKSDDFSIPLKYSVNIDSSVLGNNADGYEHVYSEVREQNHSPSTFAFNPAVECETQEELNPQVPRHMARLEPLREFTLPHRDELHEINFDDYVKEFERNYDDKEAAMRKTLLLQSSRFISSCNRQSGTFQLGANFLTDRLDAEIDVLLGAFYEDDGHGGLSFPVGDERVNVADQRLPKEFDWRPRGAVSSVKFQGTSCASCWAFAVAGSVEGALFIKTKKLEELAEQCLVDCAHSHGAHGCNGTWPSHAYNYIKDKGIPARNEYTPYMAKVLKCRENEVPPVTHISGYVDVPPNNINALKVSIRRFAPSVVVVDAKPKTFINYKTGVLQDDRCVKAPKKRLNHAVLAVGWGELRNAPHFILKNTWHEKWGDGGYIKVHAPSNTCGHLTTPSFARLKKENIDRLPAGAVESRSGFDEDAEDYDDDTSETQGYEQREHPGYEQNEHPGYEQKVEHPGYEQHEEPHPGYKKR